MRVLIATQHLDIVGGVETYLRAVLPRLASGGVELAVLAEHGTAGGGILADCPGVPAWMAGQSAAAAGWRPDVVYAHGLGDARLEADLADRVARDERVRDRVLRRHRV